MRFLKILPIIAIAFLAACKSTVPQSERLLREGVSPAQGNSSSSAELLDSSIIFERIKNYVFDSVLFDMKENYYVKTDCGCGCCTTYDKYLFNKRKISKVTLVYIIRIIGNH